MFFSNKIISLQGSKEARFKELSKRFCFETRVIDKTATLFKGSQKIVSTDNKH